MAQHDVSGPPFHRDARFERLRDYLAAKAPPGKLPGRQHIEPLEITDLLQYLMLVDVVPQPDGEPRFRFRLIGTAVVELHGTDLTGKFVDQALVIGASAVTRFRDIVQSRQPRHHAGEVFIPGREHTTFERMSFPLARDGENVDMLVSIFAIQPSPIGFH